MSKRSAEQAGFSQPSITMPTGLSQPAMSLNPGLAQGSMGLPSGLAQMQFGLNGLTQANMSMNAGLAQNNFQVSVMFIMFYLIFSIFIPSKRTPHFLDMFIEMM